MSRATRNVIHAGQTKISMRAASGVRLVQWARLCGTRVPAEMPCVGGAAPVCARFALDWVGHALRHGLAFGGGVAVASRATWAARLTSSSAAVRRSKTPPSVARARACDGRRSQVGVGHAELRVGRGDADTACGSLVSGSPAGLGRPGDGKARRPTVGWLACDVGGPAQAGHGIYKRPRDTWVELYRWRRGAAERLRAADGPPWTLLHSACHASHAWLGHVSPHAAGRCSGVARRRMVELHAVVLLTIRAAKPRAGDTHGKIGSDTLKAR